IAAGNVQAINYFVANNYVKALESLAKAPNQKVIMMPLEAASVIGSVAGLAQITQEALGGGKPPSAPTATRGSVPRV
ncbi:MAG TPA: SPFH/Band 7/PHB domain protein, partial [Planctomycetes bacterium]|nr:SPFH/Band 7/PHB domain protein [Planctomycetota bacterium]